MTDKVLSSITTNISLGEIIVPGHQAEFGWVGCCAFRIRESGWSTPLLPWASTEFHCQRRVSGLAIPEFLLIFLKRKNKCVEGCLQLGYPTSTNICSLEALLRYCGLQSTSEMRGRSNQRHQSDFEFAFSSQNAISGHHNSSKYICIFDLFILNIILHYLSRGQHNTSS